MEQSSEDIWRAVVEAIRTAVRASGHVAVKGIGFDATCSLVVLGEDDSPVAVGEEDDDAWNVVVWMDHRASAEAQRINAGKHEALRYVGGRVSLEMQTPKLVWLKEHRPRAWQRARHFFNLPDYLTWRATGSESRSLCSLTRSYVSTATGGMCLVLYDPFWQEGENWSPRIGSSWRSIFCFLPLRVH